ncbi:MAG: tetratricopeptide repeat protein, partial [Verrucomicrobia bacterium]|nr:tetratricopeptide repeat protein [Verrucomicrobiota bacterium]
MRDDEGAIADFDKTIALDPQNAEAYNQRALSYNEQRRRERAIQDFDQAIGMNPAMAIYRYNRASAWNALNQPDKAMADYEKAIELDPKSAKSHNNLGFLLDTRGEHDQAITHYTKAIELLPKFVIYYNNRGNALLSKGDFGKAMADFDKAIELDPQYSKAYRNRAGAWLVQGEFEKAIADSTRSIELDPQEARSYRTRSEAKEALGDSMGSTEDARRALILGPQPPVGVAIAVSPQIMAREELTLTALLQKDLPETRTQLAAVRHDHAFAILNNLRSDPAKEALEEALAYAKSATMLEPDHAGHWFLTGLLFRKLAVVDERAATMAEQALRQAVELAPDHAASWLELGLMMVDQKRGMEAMTALENTLASDPARTASIAAGLLCAMYALHDEGCRGVDFFEELYASNPEVPALGIGVAIMLD